MCIKDDYNNIHDYGSWYEISQFMDDCKQNCIKYNNCDYYGWLDDRLVMKESEAKNAKRTND